MQRSDKYLSEKKLTAGSFLFPIILFSAAVIYIAKINEFGFGIIESIPGVLAILSSVTAIIFIKKYKLNIIQYWFIYLISIVVGVIITVVLSVTLTVVLMPVISIITLIIECCIFECCFFDIKADNVAEKFVLLILNPVFYVQGVIFTLVIVLILSV